MQSLCLKDPQSCPSVCVWGGASAPSSGTAGQVAQELGGGGILELVTT